VVIVVVFIVVVVVVAVGISNYTPIIIQILCIIFICAVSVGLIGLLAVDAAHRNREFNYYARLTSAFKGQ
jgi:ABC-type transport system involved in cytochrome bd biosynthesis fused ATPase/permease subunit